MLHVRSEIKDDIDGIHEINRLAFGGGEEAELVKAIRNSSYFIPELSLVAIKGDRLVGHILFSPIKIKASGGEICALALAPMAVLPECQNQGVGSELVRRGLELCKELDHKIVIVIGHPEYYPRFGFKPAREYGLEVPFSVPDESFMVIGLEPGALKNIGGMIKYSPPFDSVM